MWIDLTDIHETALLNFLRLSYTEVESGLKGDTRMFFATDLFGAKAFQRLTGRVTRIL
jgi:hypothetical protein